MSRTPAPAVRPSLESLEARENPTVNYYGGALLKNVEAQPVYLGNEWSADPTARSYIDASLKDLTGGAYMDALTRAGYEVGRGTATAGVVDPTSMTSGSAITDASIQARLKADVASGLLPAPDANRLYVVYVEPNVAVDLGAGQGTTQQGVLGYHGAFAGANGATIRYAVVAYPGGAAHNSSLGTAANDQLTAVASHELAEAATDPDANYGRLGWYDPARGEIADVTENNPAARVRLDGYLVQEVADRNDQLLVINVGPPPVSPPAPGASATTTLTASAVSYHGWFATANLTVTVRPPAGSTLTGGTIELIYGGRVLGAASVRVVNGVATATFTVNFFANGSYNFSAAFVSVSPFTTSTSNSVTIAV